MCSCSVPRNGFMQSQLDPKTAGATPSIYIDYYYTWSCLVYVLSMSCLCLVYVLSMSCLYLVYVLSMYCLYLVFVVSMCCLCVVYELSMCCLSLVYFLSTSLCLVYALNNGTTER